MDRPAERIKNCIACGLVIPRVPEAICPDCNSYYCPAHTGDHLCAQGKRKKK